MPHCPLFIQKKLFIKLLIIMTAFTLIACGGSNSSDTDISSTTPSLPDSTPTTPAQPDDSDDVCLQTSTEVNWAALMAKDCPQLSDYGLFTDPSIPTQSPTEPGIAYQLSTELFSNYASKYRFLFLPDNQQLTYMPEQVFDLPIGSVLVKTFALPFDTQATGEDNEKLIETRLLIHRETGWTALAYQWQADDKAELIIAGAKVAHTLNNQGESISFDYAIPSKVECKICHQTTHLDTSIIRPIGLKAHLLNREIATQTGIQNQLILWVEKELLSSMPALATVDKSYPLHDSSASLTNRAKGYLDINCAHCHHEGGFASISGLRLNYNVDHTSFEYGVCKQPPGWDGGPNGLAYDIVPGNGERSIVHYRQRLNAPKDRMPPIGREIIHTEGTELIKRWIDSMSPTIGLCE
ncbi:hypothetical protein SJ2017_1602 [Shewanella japonica]|uniref:Cytochrome c domain-containing protein n=2 Tax=Shewanella japonica TaxID=93973 RepID=A0ABM6JIB9_9GAMM|nr:hypothetical protein SJ2017_1602 [Shewanella japonica]